MYPQADKPVLQHEIYTLLQGSCFLGNFVLFILVGWSKDELLWERNEGFVCIIESQHV